MEWLDTLPTGAKWGAGIVAVALAIYLVFRRKPAQQAVATAAYVPASYAPVATPPAGPMVPQQPSTYAPVTNTSTVTSTSNVATTTTTTTWAPNITGSVINTPLQGDRSSPPMFLPPNYQPPILPSVPSPLPPSPSRSMPSPLPPVASTPGYTIAPPSPPMVTILPSPPSPIPAGGGRVKNM